jgi:hypothetical protein
VPGASWKREDEPAILDRAVALGWQPPRGFRAPSGWTLAAPRAPVAGRARALSCARAG